MPNIYSKPVSSNFRNTYTSQFVPLPLEQFAKTNELNQARQDSEVAQLSNTSDAGHKISGAAKEDNEYVASKLVEFDTASGQLANMDLTRRENQDAAKSLVRNLSRDKDLLTIISNRAKVDEYQKNLAESKKDGTYHPANDIGMLSINDYSASGGYKSGKSIDPSIYKYQNTRPVKEEFFNNMGENGSDSIKQAGEVFYKDGFKGITEGRVNKRAMQAYQGYAATTAADQDRREYDYGVRTGTINPKSTSREAYVFKGFLDAGLERVHGVSDSGTAAALNANTDKQERKAKEKEEAFTFGTLQTQRQNNLASGGFDFTKPDNYNSKGMLVGSGQSFMSTFDYKHPVGSFSKWLSDKSFNKMEPKDQQAATLNAAAYLNGTTAVKYVEAKAGPTAKLTTTYKDMTSKEREAANKSLYDLQRNTGNYANLPAYDLTGNYKGSLMEVLRNISEEGNIKDKDGNVVSLSDKATGTEISKFIEAAGLGVKGKSDPDHFSAKSLIIGLGDRDIQIDQTYGGKQLEGISKADLEKHQKEAIRAAPKVVGEGDDRAIEWWNESDFTGKDGYPYKAGKPYRTKLSELNTVR